MALSLSGLSAFPITPGSDTGTVDTGALTHLVDRLVHAGVDTIGLLGSTGTYAYLSPSERLRATQAAAELTTGRTPLIVGIGALRTDTACTLAKDAERAGADAVLLAPVSYTPLSEAEAYTHFKTVAGATGLPLCIYNNPGTTGFQFSRDLLARLSEIDTIVGAKMPLPANSAIASDLEGLRHILPDGFSIGYSGDWGCAEALLNGADTWFSVAAGLLPEAALALTRAAQSKDEAETQRLNDTFSPMWRLFQKHGSLRVVYALAQMEGVAGARPPRPLLPLEGAVLDEIAEARAKLLPAP